MSCRRHLLCESFTLSLQQTVASLSSLELRLHDAQRLPSREDWLAILHLLLATCLPSVIRTPLTAAPDMLDNGCRDA